VRQPLSVIFITLNEAPRLPATLQAVRWADEIIVVDSGSTDGTVELAQSLGARVQVTDWPGFGAQKNRALALATCPWVLSLDADEVLSPALQAEIQAFLQQDPPFNAATLPRLSSYCGRTIHHAGWWPDPVLRLFRREQARFSDDRVHERVLVDGPVHAMKGVLLHESYRDLSQVLHKVNQYSSEGAQNLLNRGKPGGLGRAIAHGLWAFVRTYLLRRGFLDGREGFILAVSNAEGTYYRYLKLMYLQEARRAESPSAAQRRADDPTAG
jgi:glycosyltransferase involved in cell wall biosynthesis